MQIELILSENDIERIATRVFMSVKAAMPKPSGAADSIMNKKELAAYLRLSESTVSDLVSDGKIPYIKLSPGQSGGVRFSRRAIDKWLQEKAVPCQRPGGNFHAREVIKGNTP